MILTVITPMSLGYNVKVENEEGKSSPGEMGPASSAWPMKCHDLHHTGRSPYGTANTSYYELWSYKFDYGVDTDPAIGEDGTIYIGGSYKEMVFCFVAINPNGTLKWRYKTDGDIWHMCPSIAEDGTIYFSDWDECLHAVNPDGTRKWKFDAKNNIISDPIIGNDGTIYFGTLLGGGSGGEIYAVSPNGTEKWCYKTGDGVSSDAVIGEDGTIYIGSMDNYFYAMNPNGTVKWRFKTGDWIGAPASIDDDTIYICSTDGYLYALYQNGTLRWKADGYSVNTNPSIAEDGTIYIGAARWLYAINPDDGSRKWELKLPGTVGTSSSAICADGIIYTGVEIGNMNGGEITAVNPDGTLRWRKRLSNKWVDSSPCIGKDGIIYIVSSNDSYSRLHAFGTGGLVESDTNGPYYGFNDVPVNFSGCAIYGYKPYIWHWDFGDGQTSDEQNPIHIYSSPGRYTVILTVTDQENNISENVTWATIQESNTAPDKPIINGPRYGVVDEYITYTFKSIDPDDNELWYYIDWGDSKKNWFGWYESGEEVSFDLWWYQGGVHTIRAKSKDGYNAESEWSEFRVFIPRTRASSYHWLLERFPLLERLLNLIT
jgi:outer membrane protein assembly factor BamB